MKEMRYKLERDIEMLHTGVFDDYHFAIISLGTHPCAYVEIPESHPYYEKDYFVLPIDCHGGITYGERGLLHGKKDHMDGWWIGLDYAHWGDFSGDRFECRYEKMWTTKEIFDEVKSVIRQLKEAENNS